MEISEASCEKTQKENWLMTLSMKDLENLQFLFSEQHLDYQMELADGKIILMEPSDVYASEVGVQLISFLWNWVYPRKLGRVFDSSGGFVLPTVSDNVKAPDVSFVLAQRLKQSPRYFAQMLPNLTVEIKSQSDRIPPLEEKNLQFLALGSQVGILIDPDKETVTIYRSNQTTVFLENGDVVEVPELLPNWSMPVSDLWPPVFEWLEICQVVSQKLLNNK